MFRRFMIVCWVLFSLFAALAAVAGAVSFYYESEIEATDALLNEIPRTTPEELADALMADKDSAIRKAAQQRDLKEAQLRRELEKISNRQVPWITAVLLGVMAGGILLLWNMVWHTGHWIWLGRKP